MPVFKNTAGVEPERIFAVRRFCRRFIWPLPNPGPVIRFAVKMKIISLGGRVIFSVITPLGFQSIDEGPHNTRPLFQHFEGSHSVLGGIVKLSVLIPDVFDISFFGPGELFLEAHAPGHFDNLPGIAHAVTRHGNDLFVVLGAPLRVAEKSFALDPKGGRQHDIEEPLTQGSFKRVGQ